MEQFGDEDEGGGEGGGGGASWRRKPAEHRALFGGNTDDHFRWGLAFHSQASANGNRSNALLRCARAFTGKQTVNGTTHAQRQNQ